MSGRRGWMNGCVGRSADVGGRRVAAAGVTMKREGEVGDATGVMHIHAHAHPHPHLPMSARQSHNEGMEGPMR